MPGESFRFIHASDFHLESALSDLDAIPNHLQEGMANAAMSATRTVLEAALVDNVDFVVLCGDLLNPHSAGPHAMSMLLDYFEQLNAKDTPVFWAAGTGDDPAKWPDSVPLPANVMLFPKDRAVSIPVERAGRTICMVVGRSADGSVLHVPSYDLDSIGEFTVGVGHGAVDMNILADTRFQYWALGGKHNREEQRLSDDADAVYCGSPQGRSLAESGPHGYSIVDVDSDGETRIHHMECDSFRYCNVKIDCSEIALAGNLRNLIGERIIRLQHDNGGRHLIIGWDIHVTDPEMLHAVGDSEDLLDWVRREHGHGTPSAWTARLTVHPPSEYPKNWSDEETILGDFLRIAAEHQRSEGSELNLLPFTEEHENLAATAANLLADLSAANRKETLDQATLLSVELLRGGKPKLVHQS